MQACILLADCSCLKGATKWYSSKEVTDTSQAFLIVVLNINRNSTSLLLNVFYQFELQITSSLCCETDKNSVLCH